MARTRKQQFAVVLVTAPNVKTGRRLAKSAVKARLIACANIIPSIESHYWWEGKIEMGNEVLLILKTTNGCLARLERLVLSEHPYDTPEFVVVGMKQGNRRYLNWLAGSVG